MKSHILKIKLLILVLSFFKTGPILAQNDYLFKLLKEGKIDSAILKGEQAIKSNISDTELYILLGRSYFAKNRFQDAIKNFETILGFGNVPIYERGWALREMGVCHYALGNHSIAKNFLTQSIETGATKNLIASTTWDNLRFGFHSLYNNWKTIESKNFIFHFQNPDVKNLSEYIDNKERSFEIIADFFEIRLPKKIDYFVWASDTDAQDKLKRQLAFTDAQVCLTHTSQNHTLGHEMAHSISFHSSPPELKHELISEGVCVYFDQSQNDRISIIRKSSTKISVSKIWTNEIKADSSVTYPLGGELVKMLIQRYGKTKFLLLLKNQSFKNAQKIYGNGLKKIIDELENAVNKD